MWGIFWRDFLKAIVLFLLDYQIALFIVGLIIFVFLLARAPDSKGRLMVILLTLYGVIIMIVLIFTDLVCKPENRPASAEVDATYFLVALAVACLFAAATLVRRHAYAFALACLAVPLVLSIPIVIIVHLLIPGQVKCEPLFSPW
jgi:hypothetical protein